MKHLIFAACLLLASCSHNTIQDPAPAPSIPSQPEEKPADEVQIPELGKPKPIVGWPKEYDEFIVAEVAKYPALLEIPGKRMGSFAPLWDVMSKDQKKAWYAKLLYGITKYESAFNRTSLYYEDKFPKKDGVTGLPVISEGLTQLSYQDEQWYKFCKFNYAKDKAAHLDDWKSRPAGKLSWKSKHPERAILDPYVNLGCAIGIMDVAVRSDKKKALSFPDTLGYWSTMTKHREAIKAIILKR